MTTGVGIVVGMTFLGLCVLDGLTKIARAVYCAIMKIKEEEDNVGE